jgi:hypothetical protein
MAEEVNVRTFFGTIYVYGGLVKGILFAAGSGFIIYSLKVYTFFARKIIFMVLFSIFISALFLGWFDFYFNKLFFYEVTVYAFLLVMIERFGMRRGGSR